MSKEIIASVLIPAFLMQLVGCYSSKEITIADLKNLKENNSIRVVTFNSAYNLQNPPETKDRYKWSLDENNIYILSSWQMYVGNNQIKRVADTTIIPLSSIKNIYTKNFDSVNTILCVIGIAAIIGLVFIIASTVSFTKSLNSTFK